MTFLPPLRGSIFKSIHPHAYAWGYMLLPPSRLKTDAEILFHQRLQLFITPH